MATTRLIVALLLAGIAGLHGTLGFECPRGEQGECFDGLYANPLNCSTFYKCSNCIAYLYVCPAGLHFLPTIQACAHPADVNCIVSTPQPTGGMSSHTVPQTSPISTTDVPSQNGTSPVSTTTPTTTPSTTPTTASSTAPTTTLAPTSTTPSGPSSSVGPRGRDLAIFAGRTQSLDGGASPVPMDKVFVNYNGHLNTSSNVVTLPISGSYFISLSVGTQPQQRAVFKLRSSTGVKGVDIFKGSTAQNGIDTLSCDVIHNFRDSGTTLYPYLQGGNSLYSDALLQTSWSVFRLPYPKFEEVAFSVARSSSWNTVGVIEFNEVLTNVGDGYDTADHLFECPYDGFYYFSYSVGAQARSDVRAQLLVNGQNMIAEVWRATTTHNGPDTLSRATMLELEAGDLVDVRLVAGATYSDSRYYQTSFTGFLYDPAHSNDVAWSVYSTQSLVSEDGAAISPVKFNGVSVNKNGVYNPLTHTVTVSVAGIYHLQISVGVFRMRPVDVKVMVNGNPVANAYRTTRDHSSVDGVSRSLMLELRVGDRVFLEAAPDTAIYSDPDIQTSFTGFLVYTV